MKYKVGDRVRIIDDWSKGDDSQNHDGKMDKWLGKIMTINEVDEERGPYYMKEDAGEQLWGKLNGWSWSDALIKCKVGEEIDMFKYEDFKTGDIIVYENGRREIVYLNTEQGDLRCALRKDGTREDSSYAWLEHFKLTEMHSIAGGKASKILRAKYEGYVGCTKEVNDVTYKTVWERKQEVKELTVAEISKLLGYEVKVVK